MDYALHVCSSEHVTRVVLHGTAWDLRVLECTNSSTPCTVPRAMECTGCRYTCTRVACYRHSNTSVLAGTLQNIVRIPMSSNTPCTTRTIPVAFHGPWHWAIAVPYLLVGKHGCTMPWDATAIQTSSKGSEILGYPSYGTDTNTTGILAHEPMQGGSLALVSSGHSFQCWQAFDGIGGG